MLLGAYLAGLMLSYVSVLPRKEENLVTAGSRLSVLETDQRSREEMLSFHEAYRRVLGPLQNRLLGPLFFASIGYAIVRTNC